MKYALVNNETNEITRTIELDSIEDLSHKFGTEFESRIIPFVYEEIPIVDSRIAKVNESQEITDTEINVTYEVVSISDSYKLQLKNQINAKTTELITIGLPIKGIQVQLDDYRQKDFNDLFTTKALLPYPYIIWEGNDDIEIESEEELTTICMEALTFIYTTRRTGQQIRKGIDDLTDEELLIWSDPR